VPGCASIAQPAKTESAHSFTSTVPVILIFIVPVMREPLF